MKDFLIALISVKDNGHSSNCPSLIFFFVISSTKFDMNWGVTFSRLRVAASMESASNNIPASFEEGLSLL